VHCVVWVAALLGREGSGGHGPAGAALPEQEGSGDGIDYDDEDGRQRHKRGGANNGNMRQERSFDNARDDNGGDYGSGDITLRASYSQRRPLRV
jgi:hypothetical protein